MGHHRAGKHCAERLCLFSVTTRSVVGRPAAASGSLTEIQPLVSPHNTGTWICQHKQGSLKALQRSVPHESGWWWKERGEGSVLKRWPCSSLAHTHLWHLCYLHPKHWGASALPFQLREPIIGSGWAWHFLRLSSQKHLGSSPTSTSH